MRKVLILLSFLLSSLTFGQANDIKTFKHYWERGVEFSERKEFTNAISEFTNAIKFYPNHPATPGTFYARGVLKHQMGEFKDAIIDYNNSISLGEKQGDGPNVLKTAYNARGNSKALSGDIVGACKDWKITSEFGFKGLNNLLSTYCN